MGSSGFQQWESDPLFSAAEVVHDSADYLFCTCYKQLLLYFVVFVSYICYSLFFSLKLEDFEREVMLLAATDKSQSRKIAISRHKQFIIAIREQIAHVKKSLEDSYAGDFVRNKWVDLNEQDRDGLTLFLSGGKSVFGEKFVERVKHHDLADPSMMIRFLDPSSLSHINKEIVEFKTGESVSLNMNGFAHLNNNSDTKDENLRGAYSHYSTQLGSELQLSLLESSCDGLDGKGHWDLEANDTRGESFFLQNKLGGLYRKMSQFGSLSNLIPAYWSRGYWNFTRKWKDEEEQEHFVLTDLPRTMQSRSTRLGLVTGWTISQRLWSALLSRFVYFCRWLRDYWRRYQGLRTI